LEVVLSEGLRRLQRADRGTAHAKQGDRRGRDESGDHLGRLRPHSSMNLRSLSLVVLAVAACDREDGGGKSRTNVAKAAITLAGNDVSCSSPAPQVFAAGLCV